MLNKWFIQLLDVVLFVFAFSLVYENVKKQQKDKDWFFVISLGFICLKKLLTVVLISLSLFFSKKWANSLIPVYPVLERSLEFLFYIFMSYSVYYKYTHIPLAKKSVKRIITTTLLASVVLTALLFWDWYSYSHFDFNFNSFWANRFFEIMYIALTAVIIVYMLKEKKAVFKDYLQTGFYFLFISHIIQFGNIVFLNSLDSFLNTFSNVLAFTGFLIIAFSILQYKIRTKVVFLLAGIVIIPSLMTIPFVMGELKARLLIAAAKNIGSNDAVVLTYYINKALYLIAGMGVVIASFIGYIISGQIINPLLKLVQASQRIGEGDLDKDVNIKSNDEIGELAKEFNSMTKKLKQSRDDLKQTNDKLWEANKELIEKGQELVHAAKMASIGQLAGGVAHEINNPLTIIMGWGGIAKEVINKSKENANPEFLESLKKLENCLDTMEDGSKRCKTVTSGLLKISRQMDITNPEPVNINNMIDQILVPISYQPHFKNIKVVKTYADNLPEIKINLGQIQQVFMDVITNASLAMKQGGTLTISTSLVSLQKASLCHCEERSGPCEGREAISVSNAEIASLSARNDNSVNFIQIKISDTGLGIKKEDLDKIFDPFYTTRVPGEGMGLGLSVAYGIIKQHNGSIEAGSEEGKGTEITIKLPIS